MHQAVYKHLAWLAAMAITATASAAPAKYDVRIKLVAKDGSVTFAPVGQITRDAAGKITAKGIAVPALDKLGAKLADDWKAYKIPAEVKITESLPSNTGMQPNYQPHTVTFNTKDRLYKAAVLRNFLEARGYSALGMRTIQFVAYDQSAEFPPNADDRASTLSNFRKGTELQYQQGEYMFWVSAPVRKTQSPGLRRLSKADPAASLAMNYDEGLEEIAMIEMFEDGRVEIHPELAAQRFEHTFGTVDGDVEFSVVDAKGDNWRSVKIAKTSPMLLEAQILARLENNNFYDVVPAIDSGTVK
jgi:hypothetical protein